ncbi:MAG TPA: hypothetical protein VIZ65_00375 [Cellvibrionaceae bacterium]
MDDILLSSKIIMADALTVLTADMPCKKIIINNALYLRRYFVRENADGSQEWLHEFITEDGERHLHSHPWNAISTILCGGYTEEYYYPTITQTQFKEYRPGDHNIISPDRIHRIARVQSKTWTHMMVPPSRLPNWYFVNDKSEKEHIPSSPLNWWKNETTRDGDIPGLIAARKFVQKKLGPPDMEKWASEVAKKLCSRLRAPTEGSTK